MSRQTLIFLLPFALFAHPFGGSLGLTAGIRSDEIKTKMFAPGVKAVDTYSKFTCSTIGARGRLSIYDTYVRFEGDWGRPMRQGLFTREVNGTLEHTLRILRKHTEGGCAALGYSLFFYEKNFRIAPEVGLMARRFVLSNDTNEQITAPFLGVELEGIFAPHFSAGFNFDYYFAGMRRSEIDLSSNPPFIFKGGTYSGPQFDIHLSYEPIRHLLIGLHYTFTYVFTNDTPFSIYNAENQSWMTNALRMSLSGEF
jgi:hypothetical protein